MNARVDAIQQKLETAFAPQSCIVEDDSALHAGHAGAASGGGHFRINIVTSYFEGKNRIARHRLVYDCLSSMMQDDIHALAITALTPADAARLADAESQSSEMP
ncbi:BolA family protein [Herbaspirillum sp. RTI4]|uniref:BolA family protein n=1 Tax=Herbaspirillum sp. RTI4 TaxID=3048640 RepID=UPI002AB48A7C|nr:BolA family protein [Herbaspirillum sp. RTI4]MDY7578839.1 BolA family protein [Herbaspirillum sp. RTI4]MEA9982693.1 BolA family protein [Herbaspirillum sp. RTI4]